MCLKSCVGYVLSICLNAKKYTFGIQKTIQHCIEHSHTTKCIQYNIHDIKSCELPNYLRCFHVTVKKCGQRFTSSEYKKVYWTSNWAFRDV